jgi:hypothetical protein
VHRVPIDLDMKKPLAAGHEGLPRRVSYAAI